MKSYKNPKEKVEHASIQGSISKSPTTDKKSNKSSGGHRQKKAVSVAKDEKMPHSSPKIKLQLFPIDEKTQMGLEKDGHHPFLELTLSERKKISSVLKHLFNKWGSSSIAVGELMLVPFNIRGANLASCRKWTLSDIGISAGDVYTALGSPEIFRLRYGWVTLQPNASPSGCTEPDLAKNCCHTMENTFNTRNEGDRTRKQLEPCTENEFTEVGFKQTVPSEPLRQESGADTGISMASLLWSDLSNISIGGLLSEASKQGRFNTENPKSGDNRLIPQPNASDSLDAFIEQLKYHPASTTLSHDMSSSILDAESTCHSFSFPKRLSSSKDLSTVGQNAFSGLSDRNAASESFNCPKSEVNAQGGVLGSNSVQEPKMDPLSCSLGVYNNENSLGLSSIRWNDSLGPFDLALTSRQI